MKIRLSQHVLFLWASADLCLQGVDLSNLIICITEHCTHLYTRFYCSFHFTVGCAGIYEIYCDKISF
jgi:hypothetical protein